MSTHIELGHALITMIEPHRETVVAYNRWYEHDHFLSGVLTGPGAFAGRRFVSTRQLKQRRFPADSPIARPVDDGSFITIYWIEKDQVVNHYDWGYPEAGRLAALGRMNPNRRHVSTAYYDLLSVVSRDEHTVPVELALHHPYRALVMVWTERTAENQDDDYGQFLRECVQAGSPIGQVVTFRPMTLPDPFPPMPGVIIGDDRERDVLVHCAFVDMDIELAWPTASARIQTALERSGEAVPLLVAPFIPTIAGTDAYLDALW